MTPFQAARRLAIAIGAFLLFLLLLVMIVRAWPYSAQEKADLALMQQPTPPVAGRDGSDAAWLQDHDVPEAKRKAVASALRQFYAAHADDADPVQHPANPLKRFPVLPAHPGTDLVECGLGSRCLSDVRANMDATRDILRRNARGLALGMEMAQFDGLRYGLDPGYENPSQPMSHNHRLVRMHWAHRFASGQQQAAIAGLCQDLAGWRRLGANVDFLVGSMVALGAVRNDALLLADMMAELPASEPLPAACDGALAPVADAELDMCPALRFEFRYGQMEFDRPADFVSGWFRVAVATVSDRNRDAFLARHHAVHCGARALADARADRSALTRAKSAKRACTRAMWAADWVGCQMLGTHDPSSVAKWVDRRTDGASIIGALRTLAWLRTQDVVDAEERARRLKQRPRDLGLVREPRLSADGKQLTIDLLHEWHDSKHVSLSVR